MLGIGFTKAVFGIWLTPPSAEKRASCRRPILLTMASVFAYHSPRNRPLGDGSAGRSASTNAFRYFAVHRRVAMESSGRLRLADEPRIQLRDRFRVPKALTHATAKHEAFQRRAEAGPRQLLCEVSLRRAQRVLSERAHQRASLVTKDAHQRLAS